MTLKHQNKTHLNTLPTHTSKTNRSPLFGLPVTNTEAWTNTIKTKQTHTHNTYTTQSNNTKKQRNHTTHNPTTINQTCNTQTHSYEIHTCIYKYCYIYIERVRDKRNIANTKHTKQNTHTYTYRRQCAHITLNDNIYKQIDNNDVINDQPKQQKYTTQNHNT